MKTENTRIRKYETFGRTVFINLGSIGVPSAAVFKGVAARF